MHLEAQKNIEGLENGQMPIGFGFKKSPGLVCGVLTSDWLGMGQHRLEVETSKRLWFVVRMRKDGGQH